MGLDKTPNRISSMFNSVAPRYDLMNDIMTAFAHRYTRTNVVRILQENSVEGVILDLATGTGDMGIILASSFVDKAKVLGVDFSPIMLTGALSKIKQRKCSLNLIVSEMSQLPIPDAYVDACVISYGIRNVHDIPKVLEEIHRVTKPGGKLLILEATPSPSKFFRAFADVYFSKIAPCFAKVITSDQKSYQYLASSIREFPLAKDFVPILRRAGWTSVKYHPLLMGIVTIFESSKNKSLL